MRDFWRGRTDEVFAFFDMRGCAGPFFDMDFGGKQSSPPYNPKLLRPKSNRKVKETQDVTLSTIVESIRLLLLL